MESRPIGAREPLCFNDRVCRDFQLIPKGPKWFQTERDRGIPGGQGSATKSDDAGSILIIPTFRAELQQCSFRFAQDHQHAGLLAPQPGKLILVVGALA